MNPERWQQLKELFTRALGQDPERRAAFLEDACDGDVALREEVESLLASHRNAEDFLEQPAFEGSAEAAPSAAGDTLAGRSLGTYEIREKVGQGGMGVVYLAEDTRLRRSVAIKALAPQYTSNDEHRQRLKREARVAASLSHPGIATIYALEEYQDDLYIVSEYVRGRTLLEEMSEGALAPPIVLQTGLELARALEAAHRIGIIHRDLKPENVIRTRDGTIKILDFGLARFQGAGRSLASTRLTQAGMFLGTPAYASPEQLRGLAVDFRTDIFSLGIMLYEMASGEHPFTAADSASTIARILESDPVELTKLRSIVPPALNAIVQKCLKKDPKERYGSTMELISDLEEVQDGVSEAAVQAPETPSKQVAAPRTHPLWWWQFHQAVVGLLYYAMLLPMWKVKVWTPGIPGQLIFFSTVAAVAVAANLRFHLWFTSGFYPAELAGQRRRVTLWIRIADVLFCCLLLAGGIAALHSDHEVYATLLVSVAIGSIGACLLIEPTTTRAAFGDGPGGRI